MNDKEVKMVVRCRAKNDPACDDILTISDVRAQLACLDIDSNVVKMESDIEECWAGVTLVSDEGVPVGVVYNALTGEYELHIQLYYIHPDDYSITLDGEPEEIEDVAARLQIDTRLESICQELGAKAIDELAEL